MHVETFHKTFTDGRNGKFSIWEQIRGTQKYYYAKVIGTDLESYQNLSEAEKEGAYGVEVSNGKGKTVYYTSAQRLKADLLAKYGDVWLETEI